jgi:DNA-directed RNA polymerase subunit RPC12/RpoP
MPKYIYECLKCLEKVKKDLGKSRIEEIDEQTIQSEILFETSHSMNPSDEELKEASECPRCGSHETNQALYALNITCFTRGNGFLDKAGCHRDMNKYKLTQDDPYAKYRQPGEVEHLKDKLDKAGKHNPNTKYFTT